MPFFFMRYSSPLAWRRITSDLCLCAAWRSSLTSPVFTPKRAPSRATSRTSALYRSALVGMQPMCRQVPPRARPRSRPRAGRRSALIVPAGRRYNRRVTLPAARSATSPGPARGGLRFLSPPPEVRISNAFARAFDNVVATARTCYSGSGIVRDEQVLGDPEAPHEKREERRKRRDALARDLYQAGHHTTLQHAHFQFALNNVSRQFLWSFLHSHPFYNSEQVSQRYVTVRPGNYAVPPLESGALAVYHETIGRQQQAYEELCRLLAGPASSAYYARYPARRPYAVKYDKE